LLPILPVCTQLYGTAEAVPLTKRVDIATANALVLPQKLTVILAGTAEA